VGVVQPTDRFLTSNAPGARPGGAVARRLRKSDRPPGSGVQEAKARYFFRHACQSCTIAASRTEELCTELVSNVGMVRTISRCILAGVLV